MEETRGLEEKGINAKGRNRKCKMYLVIVWRVRLVCKSSKNKEVESSIVR